MITDVVPSDIPLDNVFIPAIANGLASLGRYEDTYMVHAAKGETVVPKEVLDANPGLKEELFQQMIDMGIENPKRYVVGESLNSINPITGQPEFFFSSIKKFFKKAAPVVGSVIGGAFAGPVGAAIGSGLGGKLAGQSTAQALTGAALSGLGSYVLGGYGGEKGIFGIDPSKGATGSLVEGIRNLTGGGGAATATAGAGLLSNLAAKQIASAAGAGLGSLGSALLAPDGTLDADARAAAAASRRRQSAVGRAYRDQLLAAGVEETPQFGGTKVSDLTDDQLDTLAYLTPELRRQRGGALSAALPKVRTLRPSVAEQLRINQMLAGTPVSQQVFPLNIEAQDTTPVYANQGIYVPGSQTQNQDTVPAMLTPGEFVFTREAVQGAAPNGTRQDQARAMYKMMRNLEGRA